MKTRMYAPLVLTCTRFLPILKMFSAYWKKLQYPHKTYVLSNNFEGFDEFDTDSFEYLDANIPFDKDGLHFRKTMLYGLSKISEKYVLLTLEDYIFMDAKFDIIDKFVEHMERHNIDYCSFASTANDKIKPADESPDLGITSDWVGTTDKDYLYRYSIQACLWKVESLRNLLENNIEVRHGTLDTGILQYEPEFKRIYTTKKTSEIVPEFTNDDYVVHYIEIMRWGCLNFMEHSYTVPLIKKLIKEFKVTFDDNSPYKNLLFPGAGDIPGGIDYAR